MMIKQGNRPCSHLVSDFQRLIMEAGWSITAPSVFEIFYKALNEDVKDEIAKQDRPVTTNEYFKMAIKIDNRLFERKQEKRQDNSAKSTPKKFKDSSNGSYKPRKSTGMNVKTPSSNLMATGRPKLTEEEKARRKQKGLCIYCGESGHILKNCPARPKNTANATSSSSQSSNSAQSENSSAQH